MVIYNHVTSSKEPTNSTTNNTSKDATNPSMGSATAGKWSVVIFLNILTVYVYVLFMDVIGIRLYFYILISYCLILLYKEREQYILQLIDWVDRLG